MDGAGLLDGGNLCGASLLQLVAGGSAIIAELLRLSSAVPGIFAGGAGGQGRSSTDSSGFDYDAVAFDFAYLKEPEDFENRVNTTAGMLDLDSEFLGAHGAFARRAYALFESMVKYWRDVMAFLERLERGYFIRHTLTNVLEDVDGKQLLCEAFFLYGSMLLLMEAKLPGKARERLVVAAYREQQSALELVDDVCKLVRDASLKKKKQGVSPLEMLLSRFACDESKRVARQIVARLASDDVYLNTTAFPAPEMRTTRLANQAGMLYVILYFDPDILKSDDSAMRQVVDRHYADNWVVHVYMGYTVDLSKEWARAGRPYRAARAALANVLPPKVVQRLALANREKISQALKLLDFYLTEGQLTEQHLLDHMNDLLDCCRLANSSLRWRLLHGPATENFVANLEAPKGLVEAAASFSKELKKKGVVEVSNNETVYVPYAPGKVVVTLLLKTSQLEYTLKEMLQHLLDTKSEKWIFCKTQVVDRMSELSEYFTGSKALARVRRDDNLMRWFSQLAKETESLDDGSSSTEKGQHHPTVLGRKIQTLISALEEVEQFEQVDTNLQIKAFLADTREFLLQMVRVTNVEQEVATILETISDLSYAWNLLPSYISLLHDRVRADPSTAVLLRATFVKLASILDVPLIRISLCGSPDAASVAQYYSSELVDFVRGVLDVIPVSVFQVLDDIVEIQTNKLAPLPVKFETIYLKDYAQLAERYSLAKLTNQVSVFTEGVLAMEKTLLGVIQVEPRKILHDGLRKELVRQLAVATRDILIFPEDVSSIASTLETLATKCDGYRRSVEYLQDYIDIAGLKMWQQELARLVNYAVEQESNKYLRRKIYDADSKFQSTVVPIPSHVVLAPLKGPSSAAGSKPPPGKQQAVMNNNALANNKRRDATFMGRTLSALTSLTNPEKTAYAPEACAWFADNDGAVFNAPPAVLKRGVTCLLPRKRCCGVETFDAVERALGVVGLAGLDKLLAFRVVRDLAGLKEEYKARAKPLSNFLEHLQKDAMEPQWLAPGGGATNDPKVFYAAATKKLEPLASALFLAMRDVGHCQLLRKSIFHTLNLRSRLDASHLHQALEALDKAVLQDMFDYFRRRRGGGPLEDNDDPDDDAFFPIDDDDDDDKSRVDSSADKTASADKKNPKDVLAELSKLLDASGFADPFDTIYVSGEPLDGLPVALVIVLLSAAQRLDYDHRIGSLVKRKLGTAIDGYVLVVGAHTLLKQFHPSYTKQLLAYLGQYVCSTVQALANQAGGVQTATGEYGTPHPKKNNNAKKFAPDDLPPDLCNVAWFVDHLCRLGNIPKPSEFVPDEILAAL